MAQRSSRFIERECSWAQARSFEPEHEIRATVLGRSLPPSSETDLGRFMPLTKVRYDAESKH